jgi:hypothetical protein
VLLHRLSLALMAIAVVAMAGLNCLKAQPVGKVAPPTSGHVPSGCRGAPTWPPTARPATFACPSTWRGGGRGALRHACAINLEGASRRSQQRRTFP